MIIPLRYIAQGTLMLLAVAILGACQDDDQKSIPPIQKDDVALSITGFDRDAQLPGRQVKIFGTGFANKPSGNEVVFHTVPAPVLAVGPACTELTVIFPEGDSQGKVTITANGQTVTSDEEFLELLE